MRLPLNQILKMMISSDFTFYWLYDDIYFSMVIAQATRLRMILRKTPLKVYSNLNVYVLTVFQRCCNGVLT